MYCSNYKIYSVNITKDKIETKVDTKSPAKKSFRTLEKNKNTPVKITKDRNIAIGEVGW